MTRPTDEQLRAIARNAVPTGVYSGNVKQLRAVHDAAIRSVVEWLGAIHTPNDSTPAPIWNIAKARFTDGKTTDDPES